MSARSTPSSRRWRAPVLAVWALLFAAQCAFPQHTFYEEDCYNGKDDDLNGQADCDDTACEHKVICVPPLPAYWLGPVAVWEGRGSDDAPKCTAFGYSPISYSVLYAGEPRLPVTDPSQTCPSCYCMPTPASVRCEAELTICEDQNCLHPAGGVATPYIVTNACTAIQVDGSDLPRDGYFAKAQGPLVRGACQPQTAASAVLPTPLWDYQLRACDVSRELVKCGSRDCIEFPPEPLNPALCIYKPLDNSQSTLKCPAEYPNQLVYSLAKDTRVCPDCACSAGGVTCPSTSDQIKIGDFGSSYECGSPRFELPLNMVPTKVGSVMVYPLYVKLMYSSGPSGDPVCTQVPRTQTGSVTKGQDVEFCCTDPP